MIFCHSILVLRRPELSSTGGDRDESEDMEVGEAELALEVVGFDAKML